MPEPAIPPIRDIARSAAFNLAGQGIPLLAALATLPVLVANIDTERFGLLAMFWVLVGYFSVFDLGLGRALTWLVATGRSAPPELNGRIQAALAAMLVLGVATGIVLFALAGWLCDVLLHVSKELREEAIGSFHILALCLPFVTTSSGLRGLLEARNRFDIVNALRIPINLLTFLVPAICVVVTTDTRALAAGLALVRALAGIAHWTACVRVYDALGRPAWPRPGNLKVLLAYGSWLTVSNIVGPLITYLDRFLISTLVSLAAVAYYTGPYEIITRIWLIPSAITGALFPALAASAAADPSHAARIYGFGCRAVFVLSFAPTFALGMFAPELLGLWLSPDYALHGAAAARILTIGVLVNCLANVPFAFVQAAGRADLSAKLHLVELPLYLAVLGYLVGRYGIEGAALAWTLRCCFDAAALFLFASRWSRGRMPALPPSAVAVILAAIALFAAGLALEDFVLRTGCFAGLLAAFAAAVWYLLLAPDERRLLAQTGLAGLWRSRIR